MYKLTVFVPETHIEPVKTALFGAGAGQIGNYDRCCWQVKGIGQFQPLQGSNPHTGTLNTLEKVSEWRVEMVVSTDNIHKAIDALKHAHPYETPAYDVVKCEAF